MSTNKKSHTYRLQALTEKSYADLQKAFARLDDKDMKLDCNLKLSTVTISTNKSPEDVLNILKTVSRTAEYISSVDDAAKQLSNSREDPSGGQSGAAAPDPDPEESGQDIDHDFLLDHHS